MPNRIQETIINFQGGFATDLAPQVRAPVRFLQKAENVTFERSGARRKVGGTARINGTAITSSPDVLGMYDFWLSGSSGLSTQKFVAVTSDGKVYKDDMDGTFDDITGAAIITPDATPVFSQAYDLLTIWTDKNDTPLKWDQSGNVATLGGSPPAGRGMVFHNNRGWTWGDAANPSRLTYSSSTDIEDFTGGDTGSIDIDPEDGDRIVGAVSHKQRLVVFKGPYRGSIHEISGTSPEDFARTPLVRGIPLQTHNAIVPVGDDVWFMSHRGIHSLQATERFGNFSALDLTKDLKTYFRDSLNRDRLARVWGVDYEHRNSALWCVTPVGSSTPTEVFGLSYAAIDDENVGLQPFVWKGRDGYSAAIRISPSNLTREVIFGTGTGFCERQDVNTFSLADGSAYTMKITSPAVVLSAADAAGQVRGDQPVTLNSCYLRSRPTGSHDITVKVTLDDLSSQTLTMAQTGSGFLLGTGVLDTDTLGGANALLVGVKDLTGDTRSLEVEITQGGADEDAEIYELGIRWTPGSDAYNSTL